MARVAKRPVASAPQVPPAPSPITMAPIGVTNPDAGVMATRPHTAPAAVPTTLAFPVNAQLIVIQTRAAMAAAVLVTTKALVARPPEVRAEPALNPNQPNQRNAAPSTIIVTLWGSTPPLSTPHRLPTARAAARAPTPEAMWTTVPPAKSSAPRALSQPPVPHTQWATGSYTRVAHSRVKMRKVLNLMRSAKAPVIRAGVIMANMA